MRKVKKRNGTEKTLKEMRERDVIIICKLINHLGENHRRGKREAEYLRRHRKTEKSKMPE